MTVPGKNGQSDQAMNLKLTFIIENDTLQNYRCIDMTVINYLEESTYIFRLMFLHLSRFKNQNMSQIANYYSIYLSVKQLLVVVTFLLLLLLRKLNKKIHILSFY